MTVQATAQRWRGPLVIFESGRLQHDEPADVRDMDISGFTRALHRMVHYHSGSDMAIDKIQGVKLNPS